MSRKTPRADGRLSGEDLRLLLKAITAVGPAGKRTPERKLRTAIRQVIRQYRAEIGEIALSGNLTRFAKDLGEIYRILLRKGPRHELLLSDEEEIGRILDRHRIGREHVAHFLPLPDKAELLRLEGPVEVALARVGRFASSGTTSTATAGRSLKKKANRSAVSMDEAFSAEKLVCRAILGLTDEATAELIPLIRNGALNLAVSRGQRLKVTGLVHLEAFLNPSRSSGEV